MPGQWVVLGALAAITIGTLLLMLPGATRPGLELHLIDAVFTATSAVCVTGLIVWDSSTDLTPFGQIIVLILIQIGGLGYAALATFFFLVVGHRVGLRERMALAESLSAMDLAGLIRFGKTIVFVTLMIEGTGALLLTLRFSQDMSWSQAGYFGLFHSISAFNNAGFSLFPDSLIRYRDDLIVNLIIGIQILCGGIGFLVYCDVLANVRGERYRIQTHTKIVLWTSGILLIVGGLGVWFLEADNPRMFGTLPWENQLLASAFQSITTRTAGFNTVDVSHFTAATLYFLIMLMIIGGSPGGTAGGIKTTSICILSLAVWSVIKRQEDVEAFHRRIPHHLVMRAIALAVLAFGLVTFLTLVLASSESIPFLSIMFEVASAIGTVGLSMGDGGVRSLSALFSDFGKIVIVAGMILGRFGPLMIGLTSFKAAHRGYRYPETKVVVG